MISAQAVINNGHVMSIDYGDEIAMKFKKQQ